MRKIIYIFLLVITIVSISFGFFEFLWGDKYSEKKTKIVNMVEDAVGYFHENGQEKAFEEFSKEGRFKEGEYYIFILDMTGVMVFHVATPSLIGKNLYNLKDYKKTLFVQKMIEIANSGEGKGWVEYYWMHPETKKATKKISYINKLNNELFLGIGIYADE